LDRIGHMDTVVNDSDYKFEFRTLEDRLSTTITSFSDSTDEGNPVAVVVSVDEGNPVLGVHVYLYSDDVHEDSCLQDSKAAHHHHRPTVHHYCSL
jgi:hypothetical protein